MTEGKQIPALLSIAAAQVINVLQLLAFCYKLDVAMSLWVACNMLYWSVKGSW